MLLVGMRLGEAVRGRLARIRLDDHPEGELDALPFGLPLDDLESGLRRVSHGREGTEHFDRIAHRQLLEGGSGWTSRSRRTKNNAKPEAGPQAGGAAAY